MDISTIIKNIGERLSISQLNPMQQKMAETRDESILLLSPTGSGKTIAFAIPMLSAVKKPDGYVQAVVIAPSRELVLQIYEVIRAIATRCKTVALYGGHSVVDEKNSLSLTPDVIIATPGRLLDHINRGRVDLSGVRALVLDEYDKSLELGFQDEMRSIVGRILSRHATILTSATRLDTIPSWLNAGAPKVVDFLHRGNAPSERTAIVEVESPSRDKIETLADLLASLDNQKVIVFVNYRESAERTYQLLREKGFPVGLYHGGLEQIDREKAIDLLNNGTTPILVSTDLASRGLDIDSVGCVVHYHLPSSKEVWTHRNGRTARVDASGTVYVIVSEADSLPDYMAFDRSYSPSGHSVNPIAASTETLYFDSGKREKISRGDVLGYLVNKGGLDAPQVGKIIVKDHCVLAAVEKGLATQLVERLRGEKIKGKRVRVSLLKPY